MRRKAEEHNANYYVMESIVACESGYKVGIQSYHVYTETNAPKGYKAGDREQSYGLAQIHVPVHPVTVEEANNPVFAINWLAEKVASGKAHIWTCYNKHVAINN